MEPDSGVGEGRDHTPAVFTHIVSDATGIGAERMARAGLVQFHRAFKPIFVRHPFVQNTAQLKRILDLAQEQNGLVIYTITDRRRRAWMHAEQRKRRQVIIDMLGPIFSAVGERFKSVPAYSAGLLSEALGEKSLRLAQSIDFTLRHDDGRELTSIGLADVILVGVSRTSKTPTSIYLSCHHNLKVANVPLALGLDPPRKLFRLKKPKMVGLTISVEKLMQIRRARFKQTALAGYSDLRTIREELAMSEEVFERIKGIQVLDVTDRPIEEVASLIL